MTTDERLDRIQQALTNIVGEALSPRAEYLLAYARTCGPEALESLAALRERLENSDHERTYALELRDQARVESQKADEQIAQLAQEIAALREQIAELEHQERQITALTAERDHLREKLDLSMSITSAMQASPSSPTPPDGSAANRESEPHYLVQPHFVLSGAQPAFNGNCFRESLLFAIDRAMRLSPLSQVTVSLTGGTLPAPASPKEDATGAKACPEKGDL